MRRQIQKTCTIDTEGLAQSSAVFSVIARVPLQIALMRRASTSMSWTSLYCVIQSGCIHSSERMTPG